MRVLFIAAGSRNWGSSRIRAYWVSKYLPGSEVIEARDLNVGELGKYDVIVCQKIIDVELYRLLKERCKKLIWDVCDPMWWWMPKEVQDAAFFLDGIVFATEALMDDYIAYEPAQNVKMKVIKDRIDLSHLNKRKADYKIKDVLRLIWFGVAVNRISLFGAIASMERWVANHIPIELTVFDDAPEVKLNLSKLVKVEHKRWSLAEEVEELIRHDAALLPPYPGDWGRVKSSNKSHLALACGLPVWSGGYAEAQLLFCDEEYRRGQAERGLKMVRGEYNVRLSAKEWGEYLS